MFISAWERGRRQTHGHVCQNSWRQSTNTYRILQFVSDVQNTSSALIKSCIVRNAHKRLWRDPFGILGPPGFFNYVISTYRFLKKKKKLPPETFVSNKRPPLFKPSNIQKSMWFNVKMINTSQTWLYQFLTQTWTYRVLKVQVSSITSDRHSR